MSKLIELGGRNMKILIWSKTKAGKWAAFFLLVFIVSMVIKQVTFGILPLPIPVIASIGVMGCIAGSVSFFKNKDKSLLTLLSILIGLLIIIWTAAEIAFPH